MTLTKNNYLARYYNYVYGIYPNDICSFFWGGLLAIILSPLLLYGKLFVYHIAGEKSFRYSYVYLSIMGLVFYLLTVTSIMAGNSILEEWFGYEFIYWWSQIFGGLILGLLAIVLALVGIVSIVGLLIYSERVRSPKFVQDSKDVVAAIRGKYCVKINWKE